MVKKRVTRVKKRTAAGRRAAGSRKRRNAIMLAVKAWPVGEWPTELSKVLRVPQEALTEVCRSIGIAAIQAFLEHKVETVISEDGVGLHDKKTGELYSITPWNDVRCDGPITLFDADREWMRNQIEEVHHEWSLEEIRAERIKQGLESAPDEIERVA